jgi:hypothetical protein
MIQEILDRSARAGRDKLGQLAYEMATMCLSKVEFEYAHLVRWIGDTRDVADIHRDMEHMESRTGIDSDMSILPLANPASGAAMKASRACLVVVEGVEGDSTRVQVVRALLSQSEGDLEESEKLFTRVLKTPLTRSMLVHVQQNRQATLLRLQRYEDAIRIGDELRKMAGPTLTTMFNVATAHAWLRDQSGFEASCRQFSRSKETIGDRSWWNSVIEAEAEWFADQLARDPADIETSLSLPPETGGDA